MGGCGRGRRIRVGAGESRGGKIHQCIKISRYFSRDTYRDIIFYNRNSFLILFFNFIFCTMIFIYAEKIHNNIYTQCLQSNSSNT